MKKVPFKVTNEYAENQFVLTLSGTVQERWYEDEEVIDAKLVRESLDGINEPITIRLNSPGGDVFQGIEIYNYIKAHPSHITIEVTGVAASAASIISMGADKLVMNTGTNLMVHEASTIVFGNKNELKKALNALESIDESLLSIYSEKTGLDKSEIEAWLTDETWFTADEALANGLADEIKTIKKDNRIANIQSEIDSLKQIVEDLKEPIVATAEETKLPQLLKSLQNLGGK